jgi:hypothetical protein
MSGEAFQFTPGGVVPLEDAQPAGAVIPAAQAIAQIRAHGQAQAPQSALPAPVAARPAARPLERRSFLRELKARLADVRRELRAKRRLENEEAELVRLIAAAKQPPANVTPITSARKSG